MANLSTAAPMVTANPLLSWRGWVVPAWFASWIVIYALMGIPKVPLEVLIGVLFYVIIATPVRAVPGWLLLCLFAVSNAVMTWLTVALQVGLRAISPKEEYFLAGVIAPITEELMKVLPVVILYFWPHPRLRHAFGATDWMLCGIAAGSGAQIWEDVLIRWQQSFPERAPDLFGIPLIPGYTDSGHAVFVGHVISTAFIALALGWARYIKMVAPRPTAGAPRTLALAFRSSRLFAFTPAVLVTMWMMVDHAGNNLRNATAWYWSLAHGIYFLGGRGRFAAYAFITVAVATILFEIFMLRRTRKPRFETLASLHLLESFRRRMRRLIRCHQMQYVQLATGVRAREELKRETHRSEPGWNPLSFLRRSFSGLRTGEAVRF